MNYLISTVLVVFLLAGQASAGYFVFEAPGFEEKVLKEEVPNGETVLTTINTVAVDFSGSIYYLKSDRDRLLAGSDSYTWQDLESITYSVKIALIDPQGAEAVFAEGTLPLKTEVAGILFDSRGRRLLVFVKTLTVDQSCSFLDRAVYFAKEDPKTGTKAWDWSGLEDCIHEKLSIVEITGFTSPTPF